MQMKYKSKTVITPSKWSDQKTITICEYPYGNSKDAKWMKYSTSKRTINYF